MPSPVRRGWNVPRRRGVHGIGPRTVSRGLRASHRDDRHAPRRRGCDAIGSGPGRGHAGAGVAARSTSFARRAPLGDSCHPPAGGARGLSAVALPATVPQGAHGHAAPAVRARRRRRGRRRSRTVFENRFSHVEELADGVRRAEGRGQREVVIAGRGGSFRAADVRGSDLASAALVWRVWSRTEPPPRGGLRHLDRGCERLDEKLAGLGAVVRRVEPP